MLTLSARQARTTVAAIGLLAATTLVSACDKPLLTVSVFSGSTSKTVSAQPRCTLKGTCPVTVDKVTDLTATAGGHILVDVPKKVASAGWIVEAFTTNSEGKNSPVTGAGSPQVNRDHTVQLNVPLSTGVYLLQVVPIKPKDQLSTWLIKVNLTQ